MIVSVLSSCATSTVVLDVQRPADITISQNIKNIVIVNRSRPSKENLAENIAEGFMSGEGIGYDRKGAEYCIEGLSNLLLNSDRYVLKNPGGMELKGTGTASFPDPLAWNEVISICGSYNGDALLVLETFDSDSRTLLGDPITRTRKVKGVKKKELRYPVTLIMEIKAGWRIYDVQNKNIVDEDIFSDMKEFEVYGSSYSDARSRLPSRSRSIKESGSFAGKQYGFRISPIWVKVRRTYFIGKHEDLKLAKSYVKAGDWDLAIGIWQELVNHSDKKIARRATYNMAIASEIKGGLDTAIEWADRARKLGEKKAHNYIKLLHIRKSNEKKIKEQLNN